jgi:hypothetical protein
MSNDGAMGNKRAETIIASVDILTFGLDFLFLFSILPFYHDDHDHDDDDYDYDYDDDHR